MLGVALIVVGATLVVPSLSQNTTPSSWPHVYPGIPTGDYSPAWQDYFLVKGSLPNVTFDAGRSFAGNIGVNRADHPNDTLFFWGYEHEEGSLTDNSNNAPWGIWLNGGPGSSSLLGFLFENGPIRINGDYSASPNHFSWNRLADYFWLDQPVCFVENLVKVFPNLKNRPLYLTGENYAGRYIPYMTKAYFGLQNPPIRLAKITIGDGTMANLHVCHDLPAVAVIETFPQFISYDPEVLAYFKKQSELCGYNVTLEYPQNGLFPTINPPDPVGLSAAERQARNFLSKRYLNKRALTPGHNTPEGDITPLQKKEFSIHQQWKKDLSQHANGTIDPFYDCFLQQELIDYAFNFSLPWNASGDINIYFVPDALNPERPLDGTVFLNDNTTRAAIHAPTSKDWSPGLSGSGYPFGGPDGADPSPESMVFLSELYNNASKAGIPFVFYSGNGDTLDSHRSTEVTIQNMTFGGIQGFTRKPSTSWFNDNGEFAGIVHQERNVTFVLFDFAGHQVPLYSPENAFVFLREFVLGNNPNGTVITASGTTTIVGGETPTLLNNDVLPGQEGIYVGSVVTTSTFTYPSATIAAWSHFTATASILP